jgi:uncharacterized membrane protein YeaQ/YmgE (transglycosylase-associated protein family)
MEDLVMNVVAFLLVGLFAGWVASSLVEGHGLGVLGDIVVGIVGALVGGFVFDMFGVTTYGFWGSFGMSVVGAVVFLSILGLFTGSHGSTKLGKL